MGCSTPSTYLAVDVGAKGTGLPCTHAWFIDGLAEIMRAYIAFLYSLLHVRWCLQSPPALRTVACSTYWIVYMHTYIATMPCPRLSNHARTYTYALHSLKGFLAFGLYRRAAIPFLRNQSPPQHDPRNDFVPEIALRFRFSILLGMVYMLVNLSHHH